MTNISYESRRYSEPITYYENVSTLYDINTARRNYTTIPTNKLGCKKQTKKSQLKDQLRVSIFGLRGRGGWGIGQAGSGAVPNYRWWVTQNRHSKNQKI